jgi:hypothetical protein
MSKSEIVKRGPRSQASDAAAPADGASLFELSASRFGRYASARRQSSAVERIARVRASARRAGR